MYLVVFGTQPTTDFPPIKPSHVVAAARHDVVANLSLAAALRQTIRPVILLFFFFYHYYFFARSGFSPLALLENNESKKKKKKRKRYGNRGPDYEKCFIKVQGDEVESRPPFAPPPSFLTAVI